MSSMRPKHPKYIGILLGTLYGITLRLLWEIEALKNIGGLVTISFMFVVPFVIGFIRIHYECKITKSLSIGKMIVIAWQPIFVFLLVSVVTLLEGSICVAMALPGFMFFSSLGGMCAGVLNRFKTKRQNGTLLSIAVLPLLIAPLEINFLELSKQYVVENSITIHAPVEVVWRQLANVKTIEEGELAYSLTSLIGVPKPIEASMSAKGIGSVRTSK